MADPTDLELDSGLPFFVAPPEGGEPIWIDVGLCASLRCSEAHGAIEDRDDNHLALCSFDAAGAIVLTPEQRERWPWLVRWADDHRAVIAGRIARLRARRANPEGRARELPRWEPGGLVLHTHVFPLDDTPVLLDGEDHVFVVDAYCPDPTCGCGLCEIQFVSPEGRLRGLGRGCLGTAEPESALGEGASLWSLLDEDEDLLDVLRGREADVQVEGQAIVLQHLERCRRATTLSLARDRSVALPIPEPVLASLYAAAEELAHAWREVVSDLEAEIRIRGQVQFEGIAVVAADVPRLELLPHGGGAAIALHLVPRAEAPLGDRALRIGEGLALVDGRWVPVCSEGVGAREARALVAAARALSLAKREIDEGGEWRGSIEIDAGPCDVELTADEGDPDGERFDGPEDPAAEAETEADDPFADLDGDDVDDDEARERRAASGYEELGAAFVDWCLHQALDAKIVSLATTLIDHLLEHARSEDRVERWLAFPVVRSFLRSWAPRMVPWEPEIVGAVPIAIGALATFLADARYMDRGECQRLLAMLEDEGARFVRAARDPKNWGAPKKTLLAAHGVGAETDDPVAVATHLATREPAARSRTRWQPREGDAIPAHGDPCPCGSGRRYKKCCMRR